MAIKNINELEVLEALEGGEKVLLSTDDGAKLFDAAGIASTGGGGAGEDITVLLNANGDWQQEDSLEYDFLEILDLQCSLSEEEFIEKGKNGIIRLGLYGCVNADSDGIPMRSVEKLFSTGAMGNSTYTFASGEQFQAMLGVENALIIIPARIDDRGDGLTSISSGMALYLGFVDGELANIQLESRD